MTTVREVGLLRLVALGLAGTPAGHGATDAVRALLAVQAQDLPGALTSVALRTGARDRAAVVAALDAGDVVRTWPMRGTLHLVAALDLPWLLPLAGPRMVARAAARRGGLGLDDRAVAVAEDVARTVLADGARLTRAELAAAWETAGVPADASRGYHLLVHLAQSGVVCLGPTVPRPTAATAAVPLEQHVVACDGWLPARPGRDRADDLAELALRFLTGHGPATVADLARWSSLPMGEVRTGVARVRDRLAVLEVDGVEHLMAPDLPDRLERCRDEAGRLLLLPGFDEYLLGYADRSAVLAPQHAERIVPGRNGVFRPTVVVGGQVVATWRRVPGRRGAPGTVDLDPFDDLAAEVPDAAREEFARLP